MITNPCRYVYNYLRENGKWKIYNSIDPKLRFVNNYN